MIKLSDLKAGETVLVRKNGVKFLVLEVFTSTVLLSQSNFELVWRFHTEHEINKYFTIYTEQPRIPEPTDYTKLPKVRARNNEQHEWTYGFFVAKTPNSGYDFCVVKKDGTLSAFIDCEYHEWT